MKTDTLLNNLQKAQKWAVAQKRDHDKAVNIMVGCFLVLQQAEFHGITQWIDRVPDRRKALKNIQKSYTTRRGNKASRDLVALTISTVEACVWVKSWAPYALPLLAGPERKLSEEHKAKLHRGRDRYNEGR